MGRDERLITSLSEDEKKAVRMAAAKNEMTMSEYLRNAVLEKLAQERETGNSTMEANADPAPTASLMD